MNGSVSPTIWVEFVSVAQLVFTLEPLAVIFPILPGCPGPKYRSPWVQLLVVIWTIATLTSPVLPSGRMNPSQLALDQSLRTPLAGSRLKFFSLPDVSFREIMSEVFTG